MSNKTWCDHCKREFVETANDSLSIIYVENTPIYVCQECLDKHYPLV